jgi:nucleoside-diphosphate-sugar epimerase
MVKQQSAVEDLVKRKFPMRLLITGVMGYVGPVVSRHLRNCFPDAELIGFDSGFFAHNLTGATRLPESALDRVHFGDIRDFPPALLDGIDAIVHLAAISNDPIGKEFEGVTRAINEKASMALAQMAEEKGVNRFVFASSCSIYGAAEGRPKREEDALNPLTAYARSKVAMENALRSGNAGAMTVTCLRFATACGMSDRLRLDLVLNDFVASALTSGEITVLSDGTPWRPLIDVSDMARAIEWALVRSGAQGGRVLVVNAGSDAGNHQVRDLADVVAAELPGTTVSINREAPPDLRSYKVDFSLFAKLAPSHLPITPLNQSVRHLRAGLSQMEFSNKNFRSSSLMRLKTLKDHIAAGRLSADLRWSK